MSEFSETGNDSDLSEICYDHDSCNNAMHFQETRTSRWIGGEGYMEEATDWHDEECSDWKARTVHASVMSPVHAKRSMMSKDEGVLAHRNQNSGQASSLYWC
jgi:hypothetical protein